MPVRPGYSKKRSTKIGRALPKGFSAWSQALQKWNKGHKVFCIPKADSEEYKEVKLMQHNIENSMPRTGFLKQKKLPAEMERRRELALPHVLEEQERAVHKRKFKEFAGVRKKHDKKWAQRSQKAIKKKRSVRQLTAAAVRHMGRHMASVSNEGQLALLGPVAAQSARSENVPKKKAQTAAHGVQVARPGVGMVNQPMARYANGMPDYGDR